MTTTQYNNYQRFRILEIIGIVGIIVLPFFLSFGQIVTWLIWLVCLLASIGVIGTIIIGEVCGRTIWCIILLLVSLMYHFDFPEYSTSEVVAKDSFAILNKSDAEQFLLCKKLGKDNCAGFLFDPSGGTPRTLKIDKGTKVSLREAWRYPIGLENFFVKIRVSNKDVWIYWQDLEGIKKRTTVGKSIREEQERK